MNRIFLVSVSLILSATSLIVQGQHTSGDHYLLTLEDVVQIAKEQSPQAIQARHQFRASFFSFMDYKAEFLPKLTLTTSPTSWDKSIRTIESEKNGVYQTSEVKTNTLTSTAGLALSQNIGLTGGSVSLGSDFTRRQNLLDSTNHATAFTTNPIRLSISQPLNGYNRFRWLKQIEPLRYEEAKQRYIVQMENVASKAVSYFFVLAIAKVNLNQAKTNYENQTTLYEIANGRYEIGVLAEDQLLQVKLRYMQSESKLNTAGIRIESSLNQLRSFLGFTDNVQIELVNPSPEVPSFNVPYEEALNLALTRNPDIISYNRQILDAERQVAQAKSQTGITLDLNASFGMNKTGYAFNDAYSPRFDDREGVSLRINVPILDWNQTRNRYRQAQSNLEVTQAQMQQQETDFKQEVFLQVMKFNMQKDQLRIAAMADTIAQKSYDISYARYMTGRGDITVLNLADAAKDEAKASYMGELNEYWNLYYLIRRLTLFDFLNNKELEEDFDKITD